MARHGISVRFSAPLALFLLLLFVGSIFISYGASKDLPITLTSPNSQFEGYFGYSAATNGKIVVVGAPGENDYNGIAYVFNAKTGELIRNLTDPHPRGQQQASFGTSVAIGSGFIVVSSPFQSVVKHGKIFLEAGQVYVYYLGSDKVKVLTSPHPRTHESFGVSIGIYGNLVAVGDQVIGAYIFNLKTGSVRTVNCGGEGASDFSIALSANILLEGEPQNWSSGYVCVYNLRTGKINSLYDPHAYKGSGSFGTSVAIDDGLIVAGAPGENSTKGNYQYAGNAYVYNATNLHLIKTLTSPNPQVEGDFGYSVAIGKNDTVFVGAPLENAMGQDRAGRAYSFNAISGALINTYVSPNTQAAGYFGFSIGVSSSTFVIGADQESVSSEFGAGHAYTY
jgi:hypothetical protein